MQAAEVGASAQAAQHRSEHGGAGSGWTDPLCFPEPCSGGCLPMVRAEV